MIEKKIQIKKYTYILLSIIFIKSTAFSQQYSLTSEVFDYFNKDITKIDIKHFSHININANKGGEIRYGFEGTFDTLNPYITNGSRAFGYYLVTATPMYKSPEHIARYYPYVASHYFISQDFSYVVFKIRDSAKWEDGSKITADDFVYSLNLIKNHGSGYIKQHFFNVKNAERIDETTVKINFISQNNRNQIFSVMIMPIFSKNQFSQNNNTLSYSITPPLSSGPYRIESFRIGEHVYYKKNKNHWTENLPQFIGRCNFDTIYVEYYKDIIALLYSIKSGGVDIRLEATQKYWDKSYNNINKVKNKKLLKKEFPNTLPIGINAIIFNTRKYPLNNLEIRKAITYAMDFNSINKNESQKRVESYYNNSVYSSSDTYPSEQEMQVLEQYRGKIPENVFNKKFFLPNSNSQKPKSIKNNLKIASEILENNGWKISENNKLMDKNNNVFKLKIMVQNKDFIKSANLLANNLERLGISAQVIELDPAHFKKKINDFDFDIIINFMSFHNTIGMDQRDYWHSSAANTPGSRNYAGVQNQAIDDIIDKISSMEKLEEIIIHAKVLDRILLHSYYTIPMWEPKNIKFIYWDNISPPNNMPAYELDMESWWSTNRK